MGDRVHLFGDGIDEVREISFGPAPRYIEVARTKTSSAIVSTNPQSDPIFEILRFKRVKGSLVENLYLLDEEK